MVVSYDDSFEIFYGIMVNNIMINSTPNEKTLYSLLPTAKYWLGTH